VRLDDARPATPGSTSLQLEAIEAVCDLFRDSAFADDVAKTNLAAILNQDGLQNVRSL